MESSKQSLLPARQQEQRSILHTLLWLLNSPARRAKRHRPQHSEVSHAPSVQWNMRLFAAADHVWALRRLAARGRSLGTGTAELTCCTELCLRSGYLFPQKHLPEGPDLAQTRISRVSFTIWNCKPLSAFIQHNYCCLMSTSCTVCP